LAGYAYIARFEYVLNAIAREHYQLRANYDERRSFRAALSIGWGLALVHANWYSLLVALILPVFFFGWVRLIEEKELIERFPDYSDYRKHVPAFFPRVRDYPGFFSFLILGG